MDDQTNKPQTSETEQPETDVSTPKPLSHTPQNSHSSGEPVKLASNAQSVLVVVLILAVVATLVFMSWVMFSSR